MGGDKEADSSLTTREEQQEQERLRYDEENKIMEFESGLFLTDINL